MNEFNQQLVERMQKEIEGYEAKKARFAETFEGSPVYAISNYGEDMMVSNLVVAGFGNIITRAGTEGEDEMRALSAYLLEDAERALLKSVFGHNSTSALKNVENLAQAEAFRRRRVIFREVLGLGTY